jgi:uncharacterized membrane protein
MATMARAVLEIVAIFLAPFVLFFIYRFFRPDEREAADRASFRPYAVLTLVGLLSIVAFFAIGRLLAERHTGAYRPATVENGVVQPGRIE